LYGLETVHFGKQIINTWKMLEWVAEEDRVDQVGRSFKNEEELHRFKKNRNILYTVKEEG
jgi:hypothetical protein